MGGVSCFDFMQLFHKNGGAGSWPSLWGRGRRGAGVAAGELPYLRWAAQTLEEGATAGDRRNRGAAWAVSAGGDGGTWGRKGGHCFRPSP